MKHSYAPLQNLREVSLLQFAGPGRFHYVNDFLALNSTVIGYNKI